MMKPSMDIPTCVNCKNETSIFCSLSNENKILLGERKGDNFYKKGQVIFYEGNYANGLFCLYNGKVKLSKLGSDGKEQIVRFSKTGDIIGYRALLGDEPYQATATAMEDAYICLLSKERFFQLMGENPKLSLSVIQMLTKDLKSAEQLLLDVAQKSVKERVAEALVLLKTTFGYNEDNETINVFLTRSEIADMVGSTTETTIRTLAQLSHDGVINLEGKRIRIVDFNRLLNIANAYD